MRALRRLAVLVLLAAVAVAVLRRRRPVTVLDEPVWPPLDVTVRTPSHDAAGDTPPPAAELVAEVIVDEGLAIVEPDGTVEEIETIELVEVSAAPATWVEPVDGECPDGYPVKANALSGIFHLPGGRSYARTKPERCYATAEDAEADGFRRAKL